MRGLIKLIIFVSPFLVAGLSFYIIYNRTTSEYQLTDSLFASGITTLIIYVALLFKSSSILSGIGNVSRWLHANRAHNNAVTDYLSEHYNNQGNKHIRFKEATDFLVSTYKIIGIILGVSLMIAGIIVS